MRIYRLLGLLSVLAEVEHITVQELAVRFEVSRRTILRDIDTLNEAGFPVASRPVSYTHLTLPTNREV